MAPWLQPAVPKHRPPVYNFLTVGPRPARRLQATPFFPAKEPFPVHCLPLPGTSTEVVRGFLLRSVRVPSLRLVAMPFVTFVAMLTFQHGLTAWRPFSIPPPKPLPRTAPFPLRSKPDRDPDNKWDVYSIRVEAIASRLEAIASRVEAIARRVEAIGELDVQYMLLYMLDQYFMHVPCRFQACGFSSLHRFWQSVGLLRTALSYANTLSLAQHTDSPTESRRKIANPLHRRPKAAERACLDESST